MMVEFKTLLTIEVQHDYYGGTCPDIGFSVPLDVAKLLSGLGLQVRMRDGVLRAFYPVREAGSSLITLTASQTLRFGLLSSNTQLANISDGLDPATGIPVYRNTTTVDVLDDPPMRMALVGRTLPRMLTSTKRPVTVTFYDVSKRSLFSEKISAESDRNTLSIDLANVAPGAYSLEESYTDATTRSSYYVDSQFLANRAIAVIELRLDRSFYLSPPSFKILFKSRSETLRYYVVLKGFSVSDLDQFAVQDKGYGDPDHPTEVKFERILPALLTTDEKSRCELLAVDGAKVLVFRSTSAITRRALGLRKIQLLRNTEALIENLPQPGQLREAADLIVHVSKVKP